MNSFQRRRRLEVLFAAHDGAVRAYASRRLNSTLADDVASEVFAIAWRRLEDVPEDALPWLLGCARRVIAHQHRRQHREAALVGRLEAVAAVSPVAVAELNHDVPLARALAELSDSDRELLLLIAWEGLDSAQAAKVLGCSRNALAVRLHRARRRLAAALARADSDAPGGTVPVSAKEACR